MWVALLAVLTAGSLLLSACGGKTTNPTNEPSGNQGTSEPSTTPEPATSGGGGTLTIGTFSDIVALNPIMIDDTSSGAIAFLIFANLYDVSAAANIEVTERSIAAELPKVSDDQKTYTIKLKDYAKWSDGSPITAEDVAFTINTYANQKTGSPGYSAFAQVKEARAIDPTTVEIELTDVDSRFMVSLAFSPVPAKVFEGVAPEEINNHPYGKSPEGFITSGPYKWAEWKEKQYHRLEKDPNFWGKPANIDTIVWKIYADQNTEVQALVSGEIDFLETVPVALLPVVEGKSNLKIIESPGAVYDYMAYNFDGSNFPSGVSPFAGKKTRQAIAYAINRKGMVDSVLKGHGTLLNGPFLPDSWANTPEYAFDFPYDPEKAKQLLAEDGWTPGPDGILVKDGVRFEFDLMTNSGNARRENYTAIIQQNLADVGIKVNLTPLDFAALVDEHVGPGKFQALVLGWSLSLDPDAESIFSSLFFPPAGQNAGFYKNEKTDQLWIDGYRTADLNERKAIYAEILKEFSDDPPYLFIAQQNIMTVANTKVQWDEDDAPVHSIQYGELFHIFDWRIAN